MKTKIAIHVRVMCLTSLALYLLWCYIAFDFLHIFVTFKSALLGGMESRMCLLVTVGGKIIMDWVISSIIKENQKPKQPMHHMN